MLKNRSYPGTIAIGGKRHLYNTELNSEYSMGKWGFTAKEQGESHWIENG